MVKKSNLRLIIAIFVACMVCTSRAQTQQGYVKTLGRPNQKGVALSGVSIRVRGGHNAVLSNTQGFFSMMMAGKKEGDAYALQQVQKQGYQLNDENMIGHQYAFSSKVPLTIVMVSTKQLQADKQRIENNAYKSAEKNYKTQMALLEKQQQANQITIEKYRQEIQQLQNSFEKYLSLIDGLADHYARTDYDELDAKEREINLCIENGDLDKAELLLQALDIEKRLAEIEQRIKAGQQLMNEANEEMALILKQQEKDAEYLYQLYTIALGRFDNEKARFYIETRAQLDSTNVRWQIETIEFLCEYVADYNSAMVYAEQAMEICKKREGEQSVNLAEILNQIGTIWYYKSDLDKALANHEKALRIQKVMLNHTTRDYIGSYLCLGNIYAQKSIRDWQKSDFQQSNYNRNLMDRYYVTALNMCTYFENADHNIKAETCYCNGFAWMLEFQQEQGIVTKERIDTCKINALFFFQEALKEWKEIFNYGCIGTCYMTISNIYSLDGDQRTAISYADSALTTLTKVFGEYHHHVATCLSTLGSYYSDMGKRKLAYDNHKRAYDIRKKIFSEAHPATQITYQDFMKQKQILSNNLQDSIIPYQIFVEYTKDKNYEKALRAFQKSKEIFLNIPDNVGLLKDLYSLMGLLYTMEKQHQKSVECYEQELQLIETDGQSSLEDIATLYEKIGSIYSTYLKNNKKALYYYKRAYQQWKDIEKEPSLKMARLCEDMGSIYYSAKDYEMSLIFLKEAVEINEYFYGNDFADIYVLMMASVYLKMTNIPEYLRYTYRCLLAIQDVYQIVKMKKIRNISENYFLEHPDDQTLKDMYERVKKKYHIK